MAQATRRSRVRSRRTGGGNVRGDRFHSKHQCDGSRRPGQRYRTQYRS
jgi:hypothetical protein